MEVGFNNLYIFGGDILCTLHLNLTYRYPLELMDLCKRFYITYLNPNWALLNYVQ